MNLTAKQMKKVALKLESWGQALYFDIASSG